ncbi:hypothetical protein [Zestomonas carbonaria]|uniref:Uncharacterized protein n=1 Tax=Zestomonas carbonaria TaxID=2762745 RepID=A0A7U7EM64_9GAMM|nr:hypothetical protein [Pseudomonas carbonaria]CAD5107203.1 hypothetical protein PSEWESI4_01474 [Pseudomonas carbonaria]
MTAMTASARVLRLEALLRNAKPYVGRCASIGAQQLSGQITNELTGQQPTPIAADDVEHAIAVLSDASASETPTMFWAEAMQHVSVLIKHIRTTQQQESSHG